MLLIRHFFCGNAWHCWKKVTQSGVKSPEKAISSKCKQSLTTVNDCDTFHGITRHASLSYYPPISCIKAVLTYDIQEIRSVIHETLPGGNLYSLHGVTKQDDSHSFTYQTDFNEPQLLVTSNSKGDVFFSQNYLKSGKKPHPDVIKPTRALMLKIENLLERSVKI